MEPYIHAKWPGLVVMGEPVTELQAAEILVRTANWPLSGNCGVERPFNQLAGVACTWARGLEYAERKARSEQNLHIKQEFGALELSFLRNARIVSSWVGGPHGWCDWAGKIASCNYNIGKYPSVERVTEEWGILARAFPFLDLRCQVLSDKTCMDDLIPTAEWRVVGGTATLRAPTAPLMPASRSETTETMLKGLTAPAQLREVGATHEQVLLGLAQARKRVIDGN